jgi:hypothetical protein
MYKILAFSTPFWKMHLKAPPMISLTFALTDSYLLAFPQIMNNTNITNSPSNVHTQCLIKKANKSKAILNTESILLKLVPPGLFIESLVAPITGSYDDRFEAGRRAKELLFGLNSARRRVQV